MDVTSPKDSDILMMMNALGKVRFSPEIVRGKIEYALHWEGVAFCPVEKIPGEDTHTPSLDLEIPHPEGGFYSASFTWLNPSDAILAYWDVIKRSSIKKGGSAVLSRNRCWVVSMLGEWIDVSMHVRPKNLSEGKVEVAEIEPMEWVDDDDDDEVVSAPFIGQSQSGSLPDEPHPIKDRQVSW